MIQLIDSGPGLECVQSVVIGHELMPRHLSSFQVYELIALPFVSSLTKVKRKS